MTTNDVQPLESRIALAVRELREENLAVWKDVAELSQRLDKAREENKTLRDRIDALCEAMQNADRFVREGYPADASMVLRDAWIENEGT